MRDNKGIGDESRFGYDAGERDSLYEKVLDKHCGRWQGNRHDIHGRINRLALLEILRTGRIWSILTTTGGQFYLMSVHLHWVDML